MTWMTHEGFTQSQPFARGDVVRLRRGLEGIPAEGQGIVIGWYTNEPGRVVVQFWSGGARHVPTEALERAA
jgi:hypothetical protein